MRVPLSGIRLRSPLNKIRSTKRTCIHTYTYTDACTHKSKKESNKNYDALQQRILKQNIARFTGPWTRGVMLTHLVSFYTP